MPPTKKVGLRERIMTASSKEEISSLLDEGGTFTDASDTTRRRWKLAADSRTKQLLRPVATTPNAAAK